MRLPWWLETWTAGWTKARWSPMGPHHRSLLREGVGTALSSQSGPGVPGPGFSQEARQPGGWEGVREELPGLPGVLGGGAHLS